MSTAIPRRAFGLGREWSPGKPAGREERVKVPEKESAGSDERVKERVGISRRALFAWAGGAIGLGALGAVAMPNEKAREEIDAGWSDKYLDMDGCKKIVHKNTTAMADNSKMHCILNNRHYGRVNPDPLPLNTDVVIPEILSCRYLESPVGAIHSVSQDEMNRSIFAEAQKRNIPAMLMTPYLQDSKSRDIKLKLEGLEFVVGAGLIAGGCWEISKKIRRRVFSGIVVTGLGVWAGLPFASSLARMASMNAKTGNRATSSFQRASRNINPVIENNFPESMLLAVILEIKNRWLAKEKGYKNIATIVGGDHTEMEWAADLSEEDLLKELLKQGKAIKEAIEPETVYTILQMNPGGTESSVWNKGERWEVPELKDLTKYLVKGSSGMCSTPELRSAYNWYRRNYPSKER